MPYPFYQPNYNYGFPVNYQPVMQQPVQQQPQNYQQTQSYQPMQSANMNQVQNGGFVTVRSEEEARAYPVAPGTSITFKNESAPYCYTKTMGFSQLEAPRFEKFRLVKEEESAKSDDTAQTSKTEYASRDDLSIVVESVKGLNEIVASIKCDVDGLKSDVYGIAGKRKAAKKAEPDTEE